MGNAIGKLTGAVIPREGEILRSPHAEKASKALGILLSLIGAGVLVGFAFGLNHFWHSSHDLLPKIGFTVTSSCVALPVSILFLIYGCKTYKQKIDNS